jgi:hypothetical protein
MQGAVEIKPCHYHSALGLDRLSPREHNYRLDRPHRFSKRAASREGPFFSLELSICASRTSHRGGTPNDQESNLRFSYGRNALLSSPAHFGGIAAKYGP